MSIYLDHCATTPPAPEVDQAMAQARAEAWANPSSIHAPGRRARQLLEQARARLGAALGAPPATLALTASGSEANNLALKGVLLARPGQPVHVVASAIEHDCVLGALRYLAARFDWIALTEVAPGEDGIVRPEAIERALTPQTRLVSVMAANNETGMIQPVAEIARLAHRHGALCHTDAVQVPGRLALDLGALGCDLLALAGHKFYGPKGTGVLYVAPGLKLDALVHGGAQEGRRRAGTEDVAAAAGLAVAAELAVSHLSQARAHLARLERVFWDELSATGLPVELNGTWADKLPGVLNLAVPGAAQDDLVVGLDLAGVAISAGSACSSGVVEPSHVLRAMGLPPWRLHGGVRVSFGRDNTLDEAREAARRLGELARRLGATPSGAPTP